MSKIVQDIEAAAMTRKLPEFAPGDTILRPATRAGHYIPHLCWTPGLEPHGSCRLCTVKVNGRTGAACTVMAGAGQEVQSNTEVKIVIDSDDAEF